MLLAYRGARLGEKYINRVLVPLLCRKAGVPREDVRGAITSHRARATIATQLYNAKDPMSLFELQAWLGHSNPSSTQHYARITPLTLTKAYTDAGYFARNVRTIEVLLDRDAITNGQAADGGPFEFYDLGHGYCTYTLLRAMPAPDGVRPLRLLPPQAVQPGAAARGQGRPAADAGPDPAHRRRTRGGRGRPDSGRPSAGRSGRHADTGGRDPARDHATPARSLAATPGRARGDLATSSLCPSAPARQPADSSRPSARSIASRNRVNVDTERRQHAGRLLIAGHRRKEIAETELRSDPRRGPRRTRPSATESTTESDDGSISTVRPKRPRYLRTRLLRSLAATARLLRGSRSRLRPARREPASRPRRGRAPGREERARE